MRIHRINIGGILRAFVALIKGSRHRLYEISWNPHKFSAQMQEVKPPFDEPIWKMIEKR